METRASNNRGKIKVSKSSILSSRPPICKAKQFQRQEHKTQPKGHIKEKEMARARTRTRIKGRHNTSNTISFMEKKSGMSPEIAQMRRKHKKESRIGPIPSLRHHSRQER
jgi:hypothetical protein